MNIEEIVKLAKQREDADKVKKAEPYFVKTIAWFHYLGLLRHNNIEACRHTVTLEDALKAGALEPRILELIPAMIVSIPKALKFVPEKLPADLARVVRNIRERKVGIPFRKVPARAYLHWLNAQAMEVAKRRLNFRKAPRRRVANTHDIGDIIRQGRINLALTQRQLSKKYDLSLRVIRDLEQGKLDASIKVANKILAVFGRSLNA